MVAINWGSDGLIAAAVRVGVADSDALTHFLRLDLRPPLSLATVAKVAGELNVRLSDAFTSGRQAAPTCAPCPLRLSAAETDAA